MSTTPSPIHKNLLPIEFYKGRYLFILIFIQLILHSHASPVPTQYTQSFNLVEPHRSQLQLTYSPDQNNVVQQYFRNVLTFRGSIDKGYNATSIRLFWNNSFYATAYNPQGDRFFAIINNRSEQKQIGQLYGWKIQEDGLLNPQQYLLATFEWDEKNYYYLYIGFEVNYQNKVAIGFGTELIVVQVSPQMKGTLQYHETLERMIKGLTWHPQQRTLFIYQGSIIGTSCTISYFNLNTKTYVEIPDTLIAQGVWLLYDGQIVVVYSKGKIKIFSNQQAQVLKITEFTGMSVVPGLTTSDSKVLTLLEASGGNRNLHIYDIIKTKNPSAISNPNANHSNSLQQNEFTFTFKETQILISDTPIKYGSMSQDGNEVYLTASADNLQKWTKCGEGNYLSKAQCLKCSDNCTTCHRSPKECTGCLSTQYLYNQSCFSCFPRFAGCVECNYINCLACSDTGGFEYDEKNGSCKCKQYGQVPDMEGTQCVECSLVLIGCWNCSDYNTCRACNTYDNFVLNTDNNQCECADGWQLSGSKCKQKSFAWVLYVILGGVVFIVVIVVVVKDVRARRNKKKQQEEGEYGTLGDDVEERRRNEGERDGSSVLTKN